MARVDSALDGLCPIVLLQTFGYEHVLSRNQRPLEVLHLRHSLRRAHIGPDTTTRFSCGVSPQPDLVFETQITGFVGHVDALPTCVVLPAVIGAAEAFLLVASPEEMRVAMGAVRRREPDRAGGGPERDQVLTQHTYGYWVR